MPQVLGVAQRGFCDLVLELIAPVHSSKYIPKDYLDLAFLLRALVVKKYPKGLATATSPANP